MLRVAGLFSCTVVSEFEGALVSIGFSQSYEEPLCLDLLLIRVL